MLLLLLFTITIIATTLPYYYPLPPPISTSVTRLLFAPHLHVPLPLDLKNKTRMSNNILKINKKKRLKNISRIVRIGGGGKKELMSFLMFFVVCFGLL